ncbi:hypothetical protein M408DRAFT_328998 [Serendipita vermifera MAFF 305830]|uniref:Uncharacterized protein n=1 Tax=Serendipita vermifera MAFF 305830 TaxID=933852 RepID=A0A0C2WRZ9_SERVB|nr:hypothetical protein M408DRAFT_328998 [Serendipita vermifera MAFF 305830]
MLPAPSTASNRPDKKRPSLFFPGISSGDVQQGQSGPEQLGSGSVAAETGSSRPGMSADTKAARKSQMIRDGIIFIICLALSVVYIVLGPAGEFIAGRAFTVSTSKEVTYIYYNWTVQLPASTPSLNMQAYNNRLVGSVLFTPAPATDNHYTISIETTVVNGPFTMHPWTMYDTQESGFTINISDILPNTYEIDYANIIVYIPSHHSYSKLTWNTYPISNSSSALPLRKWNVAFNNLTNAGITFEKIRVLTDAGSIDSDGIHAGSGYFQTLHGPISGEYTVPTANLTFNMNGGS